MMRINKFIAESGLCSRRQADLLIAEGRVLINDKTALPGDQVGENDKVICDGKPVVPETEKIILAYNKPVGIVCTASEKEKNNIIKAIGYKKRIYPVGRLDKDSCGLILLTNDGELSNAILKARNYHEKEYIVTVDHTIDDAFVFGMKNGVPLEEAVTRKCELKKLASNKFDIILTQGLNRQIRRMCEYFGYRVKALKRIRVVNIRLGDLKENEYRKLTETEKSELYAALGINEG